MWQNGYQTKITYCNVNEINQHLEYCKKYRQIIYSTPAKTRYEPLCAYIDDRLKYFDLPALGRRQPLYIHFRVSRDLCFW